MRAQTLNYMSSNEDFMIDFFGFIIHGVEDGKGITYHTHGLKENYNHLDLEISLAISPDIACDILHTLAEEIIKGRCFDDKEVEKDLFLLPVKFIYARESGRGVLRLILPEASGALEFSEMKSPLYK